MKLMFLTDITGCPNKMNLQVEDTGHVGLLAHQPVDTDDIYMDVQKAGIRVQQWLTVFTSNYICCSLVTLVYLGKAENVFGSRDLNMLSKSYTPEDYVHSVQ